MKRFAIIAGATVALAAGIVTSSEVNAQTLVASYGFNNTLAADQGGVASLASVDPLSENKFVTDTVFGQSRTVFQTNGDNSVADQSGLSLNTTGLVTNNSYSVEMVTKTFDRNGAWRRLIDVQNRTSDDGFYVDPSNVLDVYPVGAGTSNFATNSYQDVILVDNSGIVSGYLNGTKEFTLTTPVMDINNPANLMNFYLDNNVGGGIGEWTSADTALIKLWDGALTSSQVTTIDANPFASTATTPEGTSLLSLSVGLVPAAMMIRSRRSKRNRRA